MFEYVKVTLLTLTGLVLIGWLVVRAATGQRPSVGLASAVRRDPIAVAVLVVAVAAVVSTATSISPRTSTFGAQDSFAGLVTMLGYAALFFGTRAAFCEGWRIHTLLGVIAVPAVVTSTYALLQVAHLDPLRWERTAASGGLVRPFATLGHPNFLSAYLVMTLPLLALLVVRALTRRAWITAGVMTGVAAMSLLAVAAAVSRAAWLALAVALILLVGGWLAAGARRAAVSVLALGGLGAAAFALAVTMLPEGAVLARAVLDRSQHLFVEAGRSHIWQASLALFRDHPILGSGLDTFQLAFSSRRTVEYWLVEWNGTPTKAHNELLHVLATQGLVGGIAVAGLLVALAVGTVRAWRRTAGDDRLLVVAITASIAAFGTQAFFGFTVVACGTLLVTLAAALSVMSRPLESPRVGAPSAVPPVAVTLGAGLAWLGLLLFNAGGPERVSPLAVATLLVAMLPVVLVTAAGGRTTPDGPPAPSATRNTRVPARVRLLAVAAGVAAVGAAWVVVVQPFRANAAARTALAHVSHDPSRAIERLEWAVAVDPRNELYWVKLGTAYQALGRAATRDDEARSALLRARDAYAVAKRLVPVNPYNDANLGRVLGDLARRGLVPVDAAKAAFDAAIAADPNNAYFYADAANAALGVGDETGASRYASELVARYPGFGPGPGIQGHIALMHGRLDDATRLLRRAVDADWRGVEGWRVPAATNLAAAYLRQHRFADAEAAALSALRHAPDDAGARYNLAQALQGLGRRDAAIAEYRRLLGREPVGQLAAEALRTLQPH